MKEIFTSAAKWPSLDTQEPYLPSIQHLSQSSDLAESALICSFCALIRAELLQNGWGSQLKLNDHHPEDMAQYRLENAPILHPRFSSSPVRISPWSHHASCGISKEDGFSLKVLKIWVMEERLTSIESHMSQLWIPRRPWLKGLSTQEEGLPSPASWSRRYLEGSLVLYASPGMTIALGPTIRLVGC
jgi:hypothetical protein